MSASITGTLVPTIGLDPYSGKIAIRGGNPRAGFDLGYDAGVIDGVVSGRATGYALGTTIGVDSGVILGREQGASDGFAIARGAGLELGRAQGYASGSADGAEAGLAAGTLRGLVIGFDDGHARGYADGAETATEAFATGTAAAPPAAAEDPATITAVEPTPNTAPGDAGGFPADAGVAAFTPIVIDVVDADSFLVTVTHGADPEAIAYRAGLRGAYVAGSTVTSPAAGTLRLSLVPDGGWSADAVVTVEAHRTGADAATFGATYLLPRAVETAPVVEVSTGAVDLLDGAFALLPSYLASEAT